MKASAIASVLLGLLSSPVATAEEPLQFKIPSQDDQYVFTLSKFMDGRSKPYRVYFWDDELTGSSYRLDLDGDVVYFKAGSEVYFNMKKAKDGSMTYKMKEEEKMQKTREAGSRQLQVSKDMEMTEDITEDMVSEEDDRKAQCAECEDDQEIVGPAMDKFCEYLDYDSLGPDGQTSVKILCSYREVLAEGLDSICYDICYGPFCSNGLAGLEASGVCCAAGCGECGGTGCSQRPGGQMDCCTSKIMEAKEPCDVTGKAPCIIEYDSEEDTMDLECHRDSLSAENQKQLAEYDTDVYLEAECVSDVIPNGCNIFGLGQECRSCFASCRGALLYVENYAAEIAEKGEELIINFCPDSGESDLESCRSQTK